MNSATNIESIKNKPEVRESKKRSTIDVSLFLGILLIAVFLGLFILEFSRILSLTGEVNHAPSTTRLHQSVDVWSHSAALGLH